ncbi:MAG: DoxX family protein [Chloroflexota bacterium]
MNIRPVTTQQGNEITDPPLARFLFSDKRFAAVWAVVRVLLGIAWVQASLHKLSSPDWMETGVALKGFWTAAVTIPAGKTAGPIAFNWYQSFIQGLLDAQAYTWFAKVIAISEFAFGVLLIVGAFVGIAAFAAGFMNWNFLMAGSASTNPLLFVAAIFLVLAWKTAGYYGLDRYLLPRLGTPWKTKPKDTTAYPTGNPAPKGV